MICIKKKFLEKWFPMRILAVVCRITSDTDDKSLCMSICLITFLITVSIFSNKLLFIVRELLSTHFLNIFDFLPFPLRFRCYKTFSSTRFLLSWFLFQHALRIFIGWVHIIYFVCRTFCPHTFCPCALFTSSMRKSQVLT